jgi:hypothetical protein
MARGPALVTIGRHHRLSCVICQCPRFFDRPIQLNTAGMEFMRLGWANQTANGLICAQCGYVHAFLNDSIELWDPDRGYPD